MIVILLAIFIGALLISEMEKNLKIIIVAAVAVLWYILGGITLYIAAAVGIGITVKEKLT